MPAFEALDHYNPAMIVLMGLATFAGVLGSGLATLRALRLELASPFAEAVGALLGVLMLSLAVQVVAMLHVAGAPVLAGIWIAFVAAGAVQLARQRGIRWGLPRPKGRIAWPVAGMLCAAAAMNLLLAAAPSTKMDEIFYQTLVSARIALDGALIFHLEPWPAAILPHMVYAIASAPLHALGYQDAPNVLSWCLSVLLSWLGARLVLQETGSVALALVAAAGMQLGLYPSVYHTTGGSHALGDLATATGLLAIVFSDRLLRTWSPAGYLATLSICCVGSASAKASLVPLAGLVMLVGLVRVARASPPPRSGWPRMIGATALPWLVFYLPLCLWTLWQSGSPFGPLFADVMAPSVYGDTLQDQIRATRAGSQLGLLFGLRGYVLHYPMIFAAGTLAALLLPSADSTRRFVLGGLLLVQIALVALLMGHLSRYLSGLHHALLTVGVIQVAPYARRWLARPAVALAAIGALTLPWLGTQAYRSWYLGPVALGLDDTEGYYRSYIPIYDDLRELDRILPEDAVIYFRFLYPSIYLPRPVYMDGRDLPPDRPAFVLLGELDRPIEDHDCAFMRLPEGCRYGEVVYENSDARLAVFRRPGREPRKARLEARELLLPR